ncbi:beta-1,3-galactosyltransferase 1-like [Ruditapes philippinarum]|uniref:beta-1,3-galactosyltransferase 1-like n=1 Tax=Ruditapes philippinarum TaxID=129788 RepID=UPI00295B183F|nr:beta-1,3-galactosyltransferase 1-like [Ruditapes philippinarum]
MAAKRRTLYVIVLISLMLVLVNVSSLQYNVTSYFFQFSPAIKTDFDQVVNNHLEDDYSENIKELSVRSSAFKSDNPNDIKEPLSKIKLDKEKNNSLQNTSDGSLPSSNGVHVEKSQTILQYSVQQNKQKVVPAPGSIRTSSCNGCFQHNFSYIINNENICKTVSTTQTIDLIIMILTSHQNLDRRNAIRETWLSLSKKNTANVRYVFLLGEIGDKALRYRVLKENEIYQDIIKEDFTDSYTNLTYKTVMGYKWVVSHCSVAKYVMKTDDDMYINVWNILSLVHSKGVLLDNNLAGSCSTGAPIRNSKSKWYASVSDYKEKKYPGFCSGTAYVTSMHLAAKLYNITATTPFFHLEDVYIGLCLYKIRGNIINVSGFNRRRVSLDPCIYKGTQMYSSHLMDPKTLRDIWTRECGGTNVTQN